MHKMEQRQLYKFVFSLQSFDKQREDDARHLQLQNLAMQGLNGHKLKVPPRPHLFSDPKFEISLVEHLEREHLEYVLSQTHPVMLSSLPSKKYFVVNAALSLPHVGEKDPNDADLDWHDPQLRRFWNVATARYLIDVLQHVVVCANIAMPGGLHLHTGFLYLDGQHRQLRMGNIDMWHPVDRTAEIGWPTFATLDFDAVWQWYLKQNGTLAGFSDGPLSRAVAALSHLFSESTDTTGMRDLMWSLAGLEGLFGGSRAPSISELCEKSFALLGGPANEQLVRKQIKEMYNFRSRLIHGQRNLASHVRREEMHSYSKFDSRHAEENNTIGLSVAILLAAVQKCAEDNRMSLPFKYKIGDG